MATLSPSSDPPRQGRAVRPLAVLGGGLLLAVAWGWLVPVLGIGADKAETNYQSNLIRIQRFQRTPHPAAVLAGSSMTARLLPGYFPAQRQPVLNLGMDGCGSLTGLTLLAGSGKTPATVFVELNTLHHLWNANSLGTLEAARAPTTRLARFLPFLRAEMRPASVLFSAVRARTMEEGRGQPGRDGAAPADARARTPEWSEAERAHWAEVERVVRTLSDRGSAVVLFEMPDGRGTKPPSQEGTELARQLGLPAPLDLAASLRRRGVELRFTDGVHLTATVAQEAARDLAAGAPMPEP